MAPISEKDMPNMSCKTKAIRSAGVSVSSTTSIASPTKSANSSSCAGSCSISSLAIAAKTRSSVDFSPAPCGVRSMSNEIRPTTVVSQPPMLSTASESVRLSRSQAS